MGNQSKRLTLERVLSCPSLPSLPSVAAKVIDLTRSDKVSAIEIARAVQHDSALTGKVLKTVNSSYYGLATPCPSLSRAVTLLGLNTVKSIVLGFSLVDAARSVPTDGSLDLQSHWRRSVYTAAAARSLAQASGRCEPEEAFLGALLQDLGALAIFCADAEASAQASAAAEGDHETLAEAERELFGFDHASVGAALAEKWRLPVQLRDAIAQHHAVTPSGANADLVRAVRVAGLVAHLCITSDPARVMASIEHHGREWLGLDRDMIRGIVENIGRDGRELARSLDLDTGSPPNIAAILAAAHAELTRANERLQVETTQLKRRESELTKASITDGLTGVFNRGHFDAQLAAIATSAAADPAAAVYSLLFVDADRFKRINDELGHAAGDLVLRELARRLRRAVGRNGEVFRYGGEEFTILLRRVDSGAAARIAELIRKSVEAEPVDITDAKCARTECAVTVSVGVATGRETPADPRAVVSAADGALYKAKHSGRNRVCIAAESQTRPDASPPRTVLIVEDDALAAKLMSVLFGRRRELRTIFAQTGEEALAVMNNASNAVDVVVCDLNLPGLSGTELISALAASRRPAPPVIVVSASDDVATRQAALRAGAKDFVAKGEFSGAIDATLDRILGSAPAVAA